MSKATIERRAKSAPAKRRIPAASQELTSTAERIASDAREVASKRETRGTVNLTPEAIDAIVDGFSRELRRVLLDVGPIIARMAAADTIHTVERPAKVFGRALQEAQTAACVIKEAGVKG